MTRPGASPEVHGDPAHARVEVEPSGAERAILALLRAAKPRGLRLWTNRDFVICVTSSAPNQGWYVQASWEQRAVDWSAGGPWAREFVEYVASLGLIGVSPHESADTAGLTKAGRAHLKAADLSAREAVVPHAAPLPGMPS